MDYNDDRWITNTDTGEEIYLDGSDDENVKKFLDSCGEVKIAIPDSENTNYSIEHEPSFEERKSKAFFAQTEQEFDDKYRRETGYIYYNLDEETKDALDRYTTTGYRKINAFLREGRTDDAITNQRIDAITKAIDQSELTEDTVLVRGCTTRALEKLLGVSDGTLDTNSGINKIVGMFGTDDGFMSTGSAKNKGWTDEDVSMEILCPAGTKALYAEPFSANGDGDGKTWDGISGQKTFSNEFETILQRGTSLKVVSASSGDDGKIHVQCEVIGQDYESSAYSQGREKYGDFI